MRRRRAERGVVLLWASIGTFLVLGLVVAGSDRMKALHDVSNVEFAVEGQARQVAESGLVNALAWMRRQATQPVTAFAPQRDLTADPVIDDTDDPTQGLVRSFEISPGYWGRFVVRPGRLAEPYLDANKNGLYDPGEKVQDLDGNRRRTMAWGTRDLTTLRVGAGSGLVWHLESEGYVFRRSREDLPLGEGENVQLAKVVLATQVRRLNVTLPGSAALIQSRAEEVDIKKGSLITSPILGVGYRASTGSPKLSKGSTVVAPTLHASLPLLAATGGFLDAKGKRRISVDELFGVGMSTLRAMADVSASTVRLGKGTGAKGWKKQRIGYTIPDNALVVYTPVKAKGAKVIFDKKFPLRGQGIVVVDGNVEFKKGSASDFRGILVVLGELKVHGPAKFAGTIVVQGKSHIHGKKSDVLVRHDPALVTQMLTELSKYRRFKATFTPTPSMLDERPNEQFHTERRLGGLDYDASRPLGSGELLPN